MLMGLCLLVPELGAQTLEFGPEIKLEAPELGFARPIGLAWVGEDHLYYHDRMDDVVLQYDKQGRLIRQIGSAGEGPGEYQSVESVVEDGQDLFIFGFGRAHRFHVDGSYDRSWNVPWIARDAVPLGGERFLVNVTSSTDPDMAALALHVVDLEGNTYQSFSEFTLYSQLAGHGDRILSKDDGRVFAVPRMFDLNLVEYNIRFDQASTRDLDLSWFWPYNKVVFSSPDERPTPTVMGAWADEGLVYLFGRSPDRRWKQAVGGPAQISGETIYQVSRDRRHLLNDFYLEVIDAETGETVSQFTFDSYEESGLMQKGFRITWTEDDLGFWHGSIRSVQFQPTMRKDK